MSMTIAPGCRVTLQFSLALKDGTIVDYASDPAAEFQIGTGELVDFLESRLLGLRTGDTRHFEIAAEETALANAFPGETQQRLPRTDFPPDLELAPGQVIGFTAPNGQEIPGWVVSLSDVEVVVDFGHPLIGRDLVFDVEILRVEPA